MTVHISARVAWHNNGWNGHICKNPKENTYCVGSYSYPGEMVAEQRDINWETAVAGKKCLSLDRIPPCIYSCNAFGRDQLKAYSTPPVWFNDGSTKKEWDLPPSTTCIWPYEVMYGEDTLLPKGSNQIYNYDKRLENAKEFFKQVSPGKSLIFYYANYSNPFSENEQKRYVVIGLSKIKSVGDIMFYDNVSEKNKQKYAGGFIWQTNISSQYPDEGFCIPYHKYLDNPEVLKNIQFFPANESLFKYATREISDDNAIEIIEQFLQIVDYLIEIGDTTEEWGKRKAWLQGCVADLWRNRGAFPGLPTILKYLHFTEAISYFAHEFSERNELKAKTTIFDFLNGKVDRIPGLNLKSSAQVIRTWKLLPADIRKLIENVLCRFDITDSQLENILVRTKEHNLYQSFSEIIENPYILAEDYIGDDIDDWISFSKIDHGLLPSPDTGEQNQIPIDDAKRLRALTVECLKREPVHSFLELSTVIDRISRKMETFPDGRRCNFSENYFDLDDDRDFYARQLFFRDVDNIRYVYLKSVYDDERLIEKTLRSLGNRQLITLRSPVTDEKWQSYLHNPESPIYGKDPAQYNQVIVHQREVCQHIFQKPLTVITGAAGTGKTTIVKAILQALDHAHGTGIAVQLLAPTGKAADRLRERTSHSADTIHSFLARNGWLNENLSFKKEGGQAVSNLTTIIIDESSMMDLTLTAAFFRAVSWNYVKRLIFVGDPNQLPPIGKGKVFADILQWLAEEHPDCIGELTENIRQMENRIAQKGNTILGLASLYTKSRGKNQDFDSLIADAEEVLHSIQQGGDIDKDVRVVFWNDADDLERLLKETFIKDIELLSGKSVDKENRLDQLWTAVHTLPDKSQRAELHQILSPYRGERFGTEHINEIFQKQLHQYWLDKKGALGGITYFDKVIQVVNRPRSNPYWAYNFETRKREKVEVYNGEIGFVLPSPSDFHTLYSSYHFRKFQVKFSRKSKFSIEFGSETAVNENIELAYAISVHKAQGSEFDRVYLIIPKKKARLLTPELLYTGLTRASKHLTLFIEEDISPLLSLLRPEKSQLLRINSSLFIFKPLPEDLINLGDWYEEGRYYATLSEYLVRSKSEVILANILSDRGIEFAYEKPLFASDGTFYLPDFTITWQGDIYYLEHLGMLDKEKYRKHWEQKKAWYEKNFPGQLITTEESSTLSKDVEKLVQEKFEGANLTSATPDKDWMAIIKGGETRNVEFKQSLRWSAMGEVDKKYSEYIAMRAIASFINTEGGGTLFIGVSDSKEVVGLLKDYSTLNKKNADGFLQHMDNLINNYLGKEYHPNIKASIVELEGKEICIIEVAKGSKWVYLKSKDKNGNVMEEFFIRGTSSSQPLGPSASSEYIRVHWPN
jgi:energy-coupling factor transporter ATP-binding protein EcfA2